MKLRSKTVVRAACIACAATVLSTPIIGVTTSVNAIANSDNITTHADDKIKTDVYENMMSEIMKQETLIADQLTKSAAQPEKARAFTKIEMPTRYTAAEEKAFVEEKHIMLAHHESESQVAKTLNEYYDDAADLEKPNNNRDYSRYEDPAHLSPARGVYAGPSGKETYYNLNMGGVIYLMRYLGYSEDEYPYWIRDDGVKMFGDYVMVAADLDLRPKGTILESSMGTAIVVDTGSLEPTQLDVAVSW